MKALVVLSGGMDSTVALYAALNTYNGQVETVSFNYGSKHNDREWIHAAKTCTYLGVKNTLISLSFMNKHFKSDLLKSGGEIPEGHYADPSMKKTVVPFRNGIMLSVAAGFAESIDAKYLILGNHYGDHAIYPDCREAFVDPMGKAIKAGTYGEIILVSPYCYKTKTDICRIGDKLGVIWENTYSCYKGGQIHCGKCGTCYERKEAFREAGVKDPTEYEA